VLYRLDVGVDDVSISKIRDLVKPICPPKEEVIIPPPVYTPVYQPKQEFIIPDPVYQPIFTPPVYRPVFQPRLMPIYRPQMQLLPNCPT
jgi:hypothetical protein